MSDEDTLRCPCCKRALNTSRSDGLCLYGHDLSEVGVWRHGKLICLECERARTRRYRARKAEAR